MELLLAGAPAAAGTGDAPADRGPRRPAPTPAHAGSDRIFEPLKRRWGLLPAGAAEVAGEAIGPDRFALRADSPLRAEHITLSQAIQQVADARYNYTHLRTADYPAGRELLAADPAAIGRMLLVAAERHVGVRMIAGTEYYSFGQAARVVLRDLMRERFDLDRDGVFDLALYLGTRSLSDLHDMESGPARLVELAAAEAERSPLTEGERYALWACRAALAGAPALGNPPATVRELTRLIGDGLNFYLAAGEVWADAANAELTELGTDAARAWVNLLKHALGATSSHPSAKWLAAGGRLVDPIGAEAVRSALLRWLPLVSKGPTACRKLSEFPGDHRNYVEAIIDDNATILRGLLWLVPTLPGPGDLARAVGAVAQSAYRKIAGLGPRAPRVGTAAVAALAGLDHPAAVGQLALLKVRVKIGTAQKEIDKAFTAAAARLDLPRDQVEELGVPSYGLEEVGRRSEILGGYRAELIVTGVEATLRWSDPQGKPLKSVPAAVKRDHKDDLKEWQDAVKDIDAMLPAQRDRIDGLFLARKTWPLADWRERYGDHPLVGTIARRLIWRLDGIPVVFADGTPTDVAGRAVEPGADAQVTTWHPVECPTDEVLAWRDRLEALAITQPFKQAHREIYPLTDAERLTATYSNRFVKHIVRHHQFNAWVPPATGRARSG